MKKSLIAIIITLVSINTTAEVKSEMKDMRSNISKICTGFQQFTLDKRFAVKREATLKALSAFHSHALSAQQKETTNSQDASTLEEKNTINESFHAMIGAEVASAQGIIEGLAASNEENLTEEEVFQAAEVIDGMLQMAMAGHAAFAQGIGTSIPSKCLPNRK